MGASTNLPNAEHQARVSAFADRLRASDGAASVWFSKDDCLWHVQAETPEGMFDLTPPDGGGWNRLEALLQVLASADISRIMVEFDGIPSLYYDRLN